MHKQLHLNKAKGGREVEDKEKENQIPLKIGTEVFTINIRKFKHPKNKKELDKHKKGLKKWLVEFEKNPQDEDKHIQQLNKRLRVAFDSILGPGAYERIYEQSPSVLDNINIFTAVVNSITNKIKEYNRR